MQSGEQIGNLMMVGKLELGESEVSPAPNAPMNIQVDSHLPVVLVEGTLKGNAIRPPPLVPVNWTPCSKSLALDRLLQKPHGSAWLLARHWQKTH